MWEMCIWAEIISLDIYGGHIQRVLLFFFSVLQPLQSITVKSASETQSNWFAVWGMEGKAGRCPWGLHWDDQHYSMSGSNMLNVTGTLLKLHSYISASSMSSNAVTFGCLTSGRSSSDSLSRTCLLNQHSSYWRPLIFFCLVWCF